MAAITACVQSLAQAGDHVICGDDVYGGTNWFFNNFAKKNGLEMDMVDTRRIDELTKKIKNNTKVKLCHVSFTLLNS